jgi:orotidine-5'-phosphate decarboxylase
MASAAAAIQLARHPVSDASARLIVALDVPTIDEARELVVELDNEVSHYKVGPHLFVNGLINFIEELIHVRGKKVFLDFKSFDIGDTIRGMVSQAARLGVDFMTIGRTASTIVAAREARAREVRPIPKILVVTLLTDHDEADMRQEFNTRETVEQFVARRAVEAAEAGADGVICSPREVEAVRTAVPSRDFLIVTPGIRPSGSRSGDQKRVGTPAAAVRAGANYLVVGRPIIKEPLGCRLQAARAILGEMQEALGVSSRIRVVG